MKVSSYAVIAVAMGIGRIWGMEPVAAPVILNIQEQPLEKALQAFSMQSGLQVIFPTELTVEMTAPTVEGKFTPEAALQKLLERSGLHFAYVNARTVAI